MRLAPRKMLAYLFWFCRWSCPCYDLIMSELPARVASYVARHELFGAGDRIVVGVSGGADSLCLLHVLRGLAPRMALRLHVAHLNHGLRGTEAGADAEFVLSVATAWDIPVTTGKDDVKGYAAEHHLALEEAARQVRYAFLAATAAAVGASHIAVAHHADDQAETVLMHFLRGSGVAGLRGMLPVMPLTEYRALSARTAIDAADLLLVRPLLAERRAEIDAYCADHGLTPRIDSSNADTRLYRNRLRHELLPVLRTYNPSIDEVLQRTAAVMAGDYEVLRDATDQALLAVEVPKAPEDRHPAVTFDLSRWRELPLGLQRATVRAAVVRVRRTLRNINWDHIEHAVRVGQTGETGDSATIAAGLALTIDYHVLRIGPAHDLPPGDVPQLAAPVPLAAPGITVLGGGWRVRTTLIPRADLPDDFDENRDPWTAYLDAGAVGPNPQLRPREPGDRFLPLGLRGHSVRLNEFMINVKVPAAARARWPVLTGAGGIAWVCGLRIDEAAAVRAGTAAVWQVRFER
jgi:tRNA(Ile)-lysidine synthase